MRIPPVESLRIPEEGSSSQGKSGPKPRLKSVSDGQQVDIPVLEYVVKEGRSRLTKACDWKCTSKQ